MRSKAGKPLPVLTAEERRVWTAVWRTVAVGCAIYLGTLVWIVVAQFRDEPWTPPRTLLMLSFVMMTVLSAGVLSEGRAKPQMLKVGHGWMALGVALVWLAFCRCLYVGFGVAD